MDKKKKKKYIYRGPVYSFGELICRHWEGETWATGPAKAESNLKYRYRLEHNLASTAKVELGEKPVSPSFSWSAERMVRNES